MQSNQRWFVHSKERPRVRLFCLPYAGGGASIFRHWGRQLPWEVEVCPLFLPGREHRLREPACTRLTPLIETLTGALQPALDVPFVIFGHSMGALIGFELARSLRRNGLPMPALLCVAAFRAPHLPARRAPAYNLPDAELIDLLRRLGGTPQAVLQHAELMQVVLPVLRADFELCETYRYQAESPLECPIAVFGGEQDTQINVQELQAWQVHTRLPLRLSMFPGDHFFLHSQQDLLLQMLTQQLGALL